MEGAEPYHPIVYLAGGFSVKLDRGMFLFPTSFFQRVSQDALTLPHKFYRPRCVPVFRTGLGNSPHLMILVTAVPSVRMIQRG